MKWIKYPRPIKIHIGDESFEMHASLSRTAIMEQLDKTRGDEKMRTRICLFKWHGRPLNNYANEAWVEYMDEFDRQQKEAIMAKRRRPFVVEDFVGTLVAMGVLYDDGNVQVLWRKSLGYTGEQYHSIAQMFGIEEAACAIRLVPELPKIDDPSGV